MQRVKEYNERSDYPLEMDAGDPEDHGLRPKDVEALWSPKRRKKIRLVFP